MAIVFDVDLIASPVLTDSNAGTVDGTTSSAVASGGRIFLNIGFDDATNTLLSVAGGSLTWTIHIQALAGANRRIALCSADAPTGLASSTVITGTFSGTPNARTMSGFSVTGADTGTAARVTASSTAGGATWSSGALAGVIAGDIVVGAGKVILDPAGTATPDTGYTEAKDWNGSLRNHHLVYQITTVGGSFTAGGTWSATGSDPGGIGLAFAASGGGGAAVVPYIPRRMPLGV